MINYEVAYQINTAGNSQGLPIPSGFAIAVLYSVQKSNVEGAVNPFSLEIQVCTFKDNTLVDVIDINSDLVAKGFGSNGNSKTYDDLVTGDLDIDVRTLIKNKFRPDLDAAYGDSNVVEITP